MEPSHLPCSSLTHPAAILTPSIGVLRWIRGKEWNERLGEFYREVTMDERRYQIMGLLGSLSRALSSSPRA